MDNEFGLCASIGNLERVTELVEAGINMETDNSGRTALFLASLYSHFEIMVFLVEHGANVAHTDN
jgi:ankyrin repeat protein